MSVEGRVAGAETSLLLLVRRLQSRYHVQVACPREGSLRQRLAAVNGRPIPLSGPVLRLGRSWGGLVNLARLNWRVWRVSRSACYDIIHANNLHAALCCLLATGLGKAKLIWHARDFANSALASRICGRLAERVIAVSTSVRDRLLEQGVDAARVLVVHNGVETRCEDPIRIHEQTTGAQSAGQSDPIVFANVGRFVPWKNQAHFLRAAAHVNRVLPSAQYWLVGTSVTGKPTRYVQRLQALAAGLGIANRVRLIGWREDMGSLWSQITCLVHTARREPFGRVIIEAMAHGIPVIAVNACGPAEILADGSAGLLIAPERLEELVDAMCRIATDPRLARDTASAGRRKVAACFTADRTADAVDELYAKVVSPPPTARVGLSRESCN